MDDLFILNRFVHIYFVGIWCCVVLEQNITHININLNFLNLGVAATELQNKRFYPMACSTAAKSSMKVIRSCSAPTSLLYLCCARLRQLLPDYIDTLEVLPLPPGLRQLLHNKLGWVLSLNSGTTEETPDGPERPSRLPAPRLAGPSSSESDSEGCTSDPEACQRKRCRWTWLQSSNLTSF